MIKRPSSKDSEDDILRMQQDFFAESNRDANFQPAAKVVRVREEGDDGQSSTVKPNKQSEFSRQRKLRRSSPNKEQNQCITKHAVIGDVIEKRPDKSNFKASYKEINFTEGAFPKLIPIRVLPGGSGKHTSLFAQMLNADGQHEQKHQEAKFWLPSKSVILEGVDAHQIHEENVQKLQQMSEEEILNEREQLIGSLDPKLVDFLKLRKNDSKGKCSKPSHQPIQEVDELKPETPDLEILGQEGSDQWVNFDVLEPEKLEWTKNIQKNIKELAPGETFEARFDWKGVLQPYIIKEKDDKADDRELYLHGEDEHRPGYTLQELFRLGRANVLQQRISALNAIGGILNIFNQGFYDGVLELPISKIFFFLRFALDENTPAVVEAASRALAYMFYNDTDETLLDTIYDTKRGIFQPELSLNVTHSRAEEKEERQKDLENKFNSLKLTDRKARNKNSKKVSFETTVDDDPDDVYNRESMNDFHLAETDLLECLLRTNILERIRYILFTMRPEGSTAISCMKLLIRLARTNKSLAVKIASNEELMEGLVKSYLSGSDGPSQYEPQHLVIKLLRVLCSYANDFYGRFLHRYHVVILLKRYLFSRRDINVGFIQIQVETFRFLRLNLMCSRDDDLYRELLPALFYLLEWHYQHLVLEESGPFIIRQHCAALLTLIGYEHLEASAEVAASASPNVTVFTPQNCDRLFACFCKWFNAAAKYGVNEFSQKLLLSACLGVAAIMRPVAMSYYLNFVDSYLVAFLRSAKFNELTRQLCNSPLFKPMIEDRSGKIDSLPNLGSILVDEQHTGAPTLIFVKSYPIFLLHAILDFALMHANLNPRPLELLIGNTFHFNYLTKLADTVTVQQCENSESIIAPAKSMNWFLKAEVHYIVDLLTVLVGRQRSHTDVCEDRNADGEFVEHDSIGKRCIDVHLLLAVAFKATQYLSEELYPALVKLFDDVFFVREFYAEQIETVTAEEMQRWKFNYKVKLKSLVKNEENSNSCHNSFTVLAWRTPLLETSWPYSLLYLLLGGIEQGSARLEYFSEEQIIKTSLSFAELVEANAICLVTRTQKLMYLMTAFLGPGSMFLEPSISTLITRRIDELKNEMTQCGAMFDFEAKLEGKKSYQGLYQLVLDTFQSSSYGHVPFSALVMVPLAQKYSIQWRNIVWSEYVAVLRFITCTEQQLFGPFEEYIQPAETDATLIKYYSQALNSNLLRQGSIPARIAAHHLQAFRETKDGVKRDNTNDK
ncbi:RNA polymerase II-associated protein 1 [Toxorhynchites rutilus septentrionalis]|uniref:RNA polymerase II-associated protein 1 n=1 Tax=Toxorhynchites rutilus septentrionalis TaxID=329112 RepID=UPI002478C46B|nr:RNA polymerase II-associated protein 1 [Toxorhynchites rutilus septentrionalis]